MRWLVVFDLSGVNYIESTGLGILTFCSATMQAGSGGAAGGQGAAAAAEALPR